MQLGLLSVYLKIFGSINWSQYRQSTAVYTRRRACYEKQVITARCGNFRQAVTNENLCTFVLIREIVFFKKKNKPNKMKEINTCVPACTT